MKQILQNIKTGDTLIENVPCPSVKPGHLLIHTQYSLVSIGTERMLIDFSKANLVNKARMQPAKVGMVRDKIRSDGLLPTVDAIRSKLDQPLPLGYNNVGTVASVGEGVSGYRVGDLVVSNGPHAEMVHVPASLCARIPANVSPEEASFTVIAAIALQGIRLLNPSLGEVFVITGLGLIGLVAVQFLITNGCRVLGIDFDSEKLKLAQGFGAEIVDLSQGEDPVSAALQFSRQRGVDGVLITASSKSNEPVHQAAVMCRKRGRIILVGQTGLELSRADFYEKELQFQVSCSYGPGRYDSSYEVKGHDYPLGFVRWTAQRNFEAVLDMLAAKRIDMKPLISHRYPFERAEEAYRQIDKKCHTLGILLEYPNARYNTNGALTAQTIQFTTRQVHHKSKTDQVVVGFIGAGAYATRTLIPAFQKTGVVLKTIASSGGVSGAHAAKKFGFSQTTTETGSVLSDETINTVVIATRHNNHAHFVCEALKAGKDVFVEKPLALNRDELAGIELAYSSTPARPTSPLLMVGFNRRFAPQIQKMKTLLDSVKKPKSLIMTVNAGEIPEDHWTQDVEIGGGRIIGEACHFIDLLRFLVGSPIVAIRAVSVDQASGTGILDDKSSFTLKFADGSFGAVHYLANGHRSFPKERLEVFCAGKILQLHNFRKFRGFGWAGFQRMNLWRQNKGNFECVKAFVDFLHRGKMAPIPFEELIETTRASFEVRDELRLPRSKRVTC